MRYRKFGPQALIAGGFRGPNGVTYTDISGFPKSGTSGTLVDTNGEGIPKGSIVVDYASGVAFVNEGTVASPYWTPLNFTQRGLHGWYTDFRDAVGKAVADTAATATVGGSGLRIHGSSVADTDSGLTVAVSDAGCIASLVTGNENPDATVASFGSGTTPLFKPNVNGPIVIDAMIAQLTAITSRSFFFGFLGSAADAIAAPITGSGTTISFAATYSDEICGLCFTTGLTDADGWFAVHDKANTNASIATTATGVDPGITKAAGDVYERLRVEVDADGGVRMFINKVQVASFAAATQTVGTGLHPVIVENTLTTANATALIKHYGAWGSRA